jgi:hypothetical protein
MSISSEKEAFFKAVIVLVFLETAQLVIKNINAA